MANASSKPVSTSRIKGTRIIHKSSHTIAIVKRPVIAVVGSAMMDLTAYVEKIPGPGETLIGKQFTTGFGGKGANQAVMAAIAGAEVYFIGKIGNDVFGDQFLE
ncbi:MAG: hypothetical protein EBY00_05690, partial [Actinobacteria bacterium]|nr:hypothetical protein [Actinomycetota bacterium]